MDGGGLMPSQILEMIRDGLAAKAVDEADAEVVMAALRPARITMTPNRRSSTADLVDDDGEADEAETDSRRRRRREEDDPELMAAAMRGARRWRVSRTGRPRRYPRMKSARTSRPAGEYAEELTAALRKAVEDALSVFEDFVNGSLGDLIEDDDESRTCYSS